MINLYKDAILRTAANSKLNLRRMVLKKASHGLLDKVSLIKPPILAKNLIPKDTSTRKVDDHKKFNGDVSLHLIADPA